MSIGFEILKWITILITVYTAPLMVWMAVTGAAGRRKPKKLERVEHKANRFAVVICARNEEQVIGNLLKSLEGQDYPEEAYRIFVVADNCTDGTAEKARRMGAIVYQRFDPKRKGKGAALHWGINRILAEYPETFDSICIFDADNLVSRSFLKEMNLALCSGAQIAQGYRVGKNIHDSWVSEVYSIYWLMLMRFYYLPRHHMGISGVVGGTGFAFKVSALGEEGWTTYSLTEDVEFSIQQVCAGHTVVPARKAVFYDEQPISFRASVSQRFRWMAGGMQCIPLYLKKIIKAAGNGNKKALDLAWYVLVIPANGLALVLNLASFGMMLLHPALSEFAALFLLVGLAFTWAGFTVVAAGTLFLEKQELRPMLRGILLYPVFMFSMAALSFAALIRPKTEWTPIAHVSQYTIEDIEN
ncbi:glycosyltransferase family 2 protein [Christensenella minuta]|uniref:glycosyltransferase family 2 protein n=1 Tax=Christensenella minuta TaxID=626937 RepID=UPI002A807151|nr:glycosyltransferase family 2 protein [Christensenella minuta]MDY3751798.1 glycosyltransferase family 2 protein [Christensenella minuta]